jgi:hypothetical protein
MIHALLTPVAGKAEAISDLAGLMLADPKAVDEWVKNPTTRFVMQALQELCFGRTPAPGISTQDHFHASSLVSGLQLACVYLRDPAQIVEAAGGMAAAPRVVPPARYKATPSAG